MTRHKRCFFLDLETTGLDENTCFILEIGAKITDTDYRVLDEFNIIVHQSRSRLHSMNSWCKKQHSKSGLIKESKGSMMSLSEAQQDLLKWMAKHYLKKDVILYGNSIHFDRKFIKKYLPLVEKRLSYRMVDITSFKIVFESQFGVEIVKPVSAHRVLEDIDDSIYELKTYIKYINGGKK
jgi:oligoribonuclease